MWFWNAAGRKPKDMLVFRVKGLYRRGLMQWTLKRNERMVGNVVEQR